jgi:hypothetical protein
VIFPPSVEIWRPILGRYSAGLPMDFLLAWIQKESYGNPCSWTSLREAGIFQLMIGSNQTVAGTSEAALRSACMPVPSSSLAHSLTAAEADEQARSGVAYVRWAVATAKKKLAAAGVTWPESSKDFGKMVMFVHILPGKIAPWLAAARAGLGRPPRSWFELVPYASSVGISAKWITHADWIGSHWGGSQIPLVAAALLVGGGAVLYYLYRKAA